MSNPIAFRAHPTGNITLPTAGTYNSVILPSVTPNVGDVSSGYNEGSRYNVATGKWTPVQGEERAAIVSFAGQVWVTGAGGVAGGDNFVVRVVKNWSSSGAATVGAAIASKGVFAGDWVIPVSMQDLASAGDEYEILVYTVFANRNIDGHPLHTFWSGAVVK